jgi:hypothetical protein
MNANAKAAIVCPDRCGPVVRVLLVAAALLGCSGVLAGPIRVVRPASDETVHSNSGDIEVIVAGAAPDARLRPLLDGQPVGGAHASPSFDLHGVGRGTHQLVVVEIDGQAREIGRSAPVEFQVWHASRLNRAGPR